MSRLRISAVALALPLLACGDDTRGDASSASASASASIGSITLPMTGSAGASEASDSGASGGLTGTSDPTGGDPTTGGVVTNSGGDTLPKFDIGTPPDGGASCGGNGGDIDESFIWIPATSAGYVSKINTRTLVEEARYYTGPDGAAESVSRTAVSGDGRFVVVNARGTGRSTAVAANINDCVDQNGDGVISTSTGVGDILPWGTDECVRWTILHPNWDGGDSHGPRGITWTIGTWDKAQCAFVDQKVWLGYSGAGNTAYLVRIDGPTGTVEETIEAPAWDGSNYAPYGGALDPQGHAWFTGLRGELARVNTEQNPITVTRITQPGNIQSYGMTVDPDGNPWMGGCSGPVSTYDLPSSQWITIPGTQACHRGMAVDHDFHVWVASNSPCGLVEIDGKTRTLIAQHSLAQCSTPIGVSVDVDGYVWLVDQAGWAWKIDTTNVAAMQQIIVEGNHYVYSDMTGGQLKSVSPPPG